jgi:glutathione-regulated potassium-efflux system ancillary protein KefG
MAAVKDLEKLRVHDLYERYSAFTINVVREQELLHTHDVIVFQHPVYGTTVRRC